MMVPSFHAAAAAGVRACLVRSGKGRRAESELRDPGVTVFDDLLGFARTVSTDCLQVQGWY